MHMLHHACIIHGCMHHTCIHGHMHTCTHAYNAYMHVNVLPVSECPSPVLKVPSRRIYMGHHDAGATTARKMRDSEPAWRDEINELDRNGILSYTRTFIHTYVCASMHTVILCLTWIRVGTVSYTIRTIKRTVRTALPNHYLLHCTIQSFFQ